MLRNSSHYEGGKRTTTINTHGIGFNYVEFVIELNEDPTFKTVDGGLMVMAGVQDLEGELLVRNRRMVFAPNTAPLKAVLGKTRCGRLHVLGIPRMSLAVISWRTRNRTARPEVLRWNLPYEMIITAVYDDDLEPLDDCTGK